MIPWEPTAQKTEEVIQEFYHTHLDYWAGKPYEGSTNKDKAVGMLYARELLAWLEGNCDNEAHIALRPKTVEGTPWASRFDCPLCMEELRQELGE